MCRSRFNWPSYALYQKSRKPDVSWAAVNSSGSLRMDKQAQNQHSMMSSPLCSQLITLSLLIWVSISSFGAFFSFFFFFWACFSSFCLLLRSVHEDLFCSVERKGSTVWCPSTTHFAFLVSSSSQPVQLFSSKFGLQSCLTPFSHYAVEDSAIAHAAEK